MKTSMMRLGKVVKSNSHCDYVVQLYDKMEVQHPPGPEDYGFGCFVKLEEPEKRHWAVGLIYNSQLFNPRFLNNGPRLSSEPDPLFTPDLIGETRVILGTVLIGTLENYSGQRYGRHGIPSAVVPVNTPVFKMTEQEVYRFHLDRENRPQLSYYSHLMRSGGIFASQLTQQVLTELINSNLFRGADRRVLEILCKELSWKNTMGAMR